MADLELVLAIDTASPLPAVALFARGCVFEERLPADRRASEGLLDAAARCLASAEIDLAKVPRLAVCAGPGSFTGLRVGLATAWGLSRAAGASVETVSTFEAMAEASRGIGAERVRVALDAGRGEAVFQSFRLSENRAAPIGPIRREPLEAARRPAAGEILVALPPELFGGTAQGLRVSPAHALALAAARAPRPEGSRSFEPIYSRASAAEEKRGAA